MVVYAEQSKEMIKAKQKIVDISINEKFDVMGHMTDMVIHGLTTSLLITGDGGLGKTYMVMKQLAAHNLKEDVDFVEIKGHSTAKALFETIRDNHNKLLVFDDCDSVLKDPISLNIFKAILDTKSRRRVNWNSNGEHEFVTFTGRVIFVSNLPPAKITQALISRVLHVDVSMTRQEKIDRMAAVLKDVTKEINGLLKATVTNSGKKFNIRTDGIKLADTKKALDFIDKYSKMGVVDDLNFRTLHKVIKVIKYAQTKKIKDWTKLAMVAVLNNSQL